MLRECRIFCVNLRNMIIDWKMILHRIYSFSSLFASNLWLIDSDTLLWPNIVPGQWPALVLSSDHLFVTIWSLCKLWPLPQPYIKSADLERQKEGKFCAKYFSVNYCCLLSRPRPWQLNKVELGVHCCSIRPTWDDQLTNQPTNMGWSEMLLL